MATPPVLASCMLQNESCGPPRSFCLPHNLLHVDPVFSSKPAAISPDSLRCAFRTRLLQPLYPPPSQLRM
ncbi:hypothetical protein PF010_g32812, partial [Phytophthora fragariae]